MERGTMILALLLAIAALGRAADEAAPTRRPYRDGPLTAEDFQGTPEANSPYKAWTSANLQFRYAYRYRTQNRQTVVTLTEIDVWAEVERDKSWNRRPKDPLLMDHEQGHFDIAHAHALEAQAKLRETLGTAKALKTSGPSEAKAAELLQQKLREAVEAYVEALREANRQYDKDTTSGSDAAAQAEARRAQQQRIRELIAAEEKRAP